MEKSMKISINNSRNHSWSKILIILFQLNRKTCKFPLNWVFQMFFRDLCLFLLVYYQFKANIFNFRLHLVARYLIIPMFILKKCIWNANLIRFKGKLQFSVNNVLMNNSQMLSISSLLGALITTLNKSVLFYCVFWFHVQNVLWKHDFLYSYKFC